MSRRPRRQEAVATALQGVRPQRDVVLLLRRGAVALGRGAINGLLLGPLRLLRWLHSRSARRGCVAARRARRDWRDDPEPAGDPLLQRAVAPAGDAIQAILAPGRRALAAIRNLLQRVLDVGRYFFPGFLLRLLRPRQPCPRPRQPCPRPRQQQETQPPPTPEKKSAFAYLYKYNPLRRRRAPASPTPTPSSSPQRPEPHTVDGEIVPDEEVIEYAKYCRDAKVCPANKTRCHLCCFEMQKSPDFVVRTNELIWHCNTAHKGKSVLCGKGGCMIKVRSARDLARHTYFCHTLPTDWWQAYV